MILHTGIALGVTLVVLAGALAILQYREKVCFLVFLLENFQTSLCYRLKMIVNVKFKHKHFIMMLYDLFLFFFKLVSNSTQSSGQICFSDFYFISDFGRANLFVFCLVYFLC